MLSNFKKTISLLLIVAFAFAQTSFSQGIDDLKRSGQSIIVDGDKVEFFEKEGKIIAEGNVSITYGETKLSCDRIEVNTRTKIALCEGNVRVEQPEGVLVGERIRYDFNKKQGEIISGDVKAYPWFGKADEVARVSEDEFLLRNGYISTCDHDFPHYRVKAKEIRVFPDDKIIARNVVVYIGKVPVMWFPYYYHPIIQSRAKVQFIPGVTSDWGYFLLSAWRFHLKGNTKMDVLLDYREKKGFAEGVDLYYNMADLGARELGDGVFRAYFIHQNDRGTYDPQPFREGEGDDPELRKRFQWKHRIDFDRETVGMLEFNKLSDRNVIKDYFYNEYEEEARVPPNFISIINSKPDYTFSFQMERRFNDFYTVVQKLPELKLTVPDQRLWETPLYYSTQLSGTNFDKQYNFESSPPEKVQRFDWFHKLSYVTGIGPLNLTPYGTLRETVYSRNKWEWKPMARTAFGGGLNAFMRFSRIFDVETDAWGLDIHQLRHIIVPSADYFYTHQPTVDKDSLYQMDEIDELEKENGVTLSLENKLQTKKPTDDGYDVIDLVRFIVSVDFLFRMEKDRFEFEKNGKFKDLEFDLELSPYDWLFIDGELEITPENQAIETGSLEAAITPTEWFQTALGYRYAKMQPEPRNQLTFDIYFKLNEKWRFGIYERFDMQDFDIEEQQYSVVRDLHCWEVEFTYDTKGSNFTEDYTVWLAFKIKAFPDLPIGLNRSFKKRPPGGLRTRNGYGSGSAY
ncbi:MAG: LPS assembly protein LptD [Candidatus Omnitrophica bacterium]|nr:LPS assembly protein LptD [Candidatus Omnitrophota bacterium]